MEKPRPKATPDGASPPPRNRGDRETVAALLAGDESAYLELVDRLHPAMVRLAAGRLPSRQLAEDVAQETWMAVLQGLPRFELRCSLRTWILTILLNRTRRRAAAERRARRLAGPLAELQEVPEMLPAAPADAGGRPPTDLGPTPEEGLLSGELRHRLDRAIESLPRVQRTVLTLRDVEGWTAAEVCQLLEISDNNQRVILHRARLKVRDLIAGYLNPPAPPSDDRA